MKKQWLVILGVGVVAGLIGAGWWFRQQRACSRLSLERIAGLHDVVPFAIIGSGPAGLSAGLYGARLGYDTIIFEGPKPGGQLTETGYVENWPGVPRALGPEIMAQQRAYVAKFGARLLSDSIVQIDLSHWPFTLTTETGQHVTALAVIIATGSAPRIMQVPGEREYWGKGVTTCALCDAPYYKNKDVVVIGGGDTALEEALQLVAYVRSVTLLVRRDSLRASAAMQMRVRTNKHISIRFNCAVEAIVGDGASVTGVTVRNMRTRATEQISASGVFLAIGHEPRTKLVAGQLALDREGYIGLSGRDQQTNIEGVFAAGDVTDAVYRQAGVAAGDGIKAAIDAARFLQKLGWDRDRAQTLGVALYEPHDITRGAAEPAELGSKAAYRRLIAHAHKPVIVDCYAKHCPSCMHMLPTFQAVANEMRGEADFYKLNTTNVPELTEFFGVERVPCFLVIKHGNVIARHYAIMNRVQMRDMVKQTRA